MDTTTDYELWDRHAIAEFLGIAPGSVKNWVTRNEVPVAGHSEPVRGGSAYLYRAEDVRQASAAAPGKGNRTRRARKNHDQD